MACICRYFCTYIIHAYILYINTQTQTFTNSLCTNHVDEYVIGQDTTGEASPAKSADSGTPRKPQAERSHST